jgi:hypothetical protein
MAEVIRAMRNWLAYSTMGDEEWEFLRGTHIEQEVRRLFCTVKDPRAEDGELGPVSIPVRSGALRQLRRVPGKAFLSRDEGEAGERYRLHVMASATPRDGEPETWEPLCTWEFDSASDVMDFVGPPPEDSAS